MFIAVKGNCLIFLITGRIVYFQEKDGHKLERNFDTLRDLLNEHGRKCGAYFGGYLISELPSSTSTETRIILKTFCVWVKCDNDRISERDCSPYVSVADFLASEGLDVEKWCYRVKIGDEVIHPSDAIKKIHKFKTTQNSPMVITSFYVYIQCNEGEVYMKAFPPHLPVKEFMNEYNVSSAMIGHLVLDIRSNDHMVKYTTTSIIPMVLHHKIWIKRDENPAFLETFPHISIRCLVKQDLDSRVMQGGQILSDSDCEMISVLKTTSDNPVCISSWIKIPVTNKGKTRTYCVKATQLIKEFVQGEFGQNAFAYNDETTLKVNTDQMFKNTYYNENCGFSVDNRKVLVMMQHSSKREVDLSDCRCIGDVVKKLNGQAAYDFHTYTQLDEEMVLDTFIMKNKQGRCCIFITSLSIPVVFKSSHSVSHAAKTNDGQAITKHVASYEVYSHYLAVEIYDSWKFEQPECKSVVAKFQHILQCMEHNFHLAHETFYTSIIAQELDRFLKDCVEDDIASFHRIPIKHNKNSATTDSYPDFYFAQVHNGIPTKALLATDFKKEDEDYGIAEVESFGYCLDILHHSRSFNPILAIPGTTKKFALFICFPIGGAQTNLASIKIGEADVHDTRQMNHFFSALKYAVKRITSINYREAFVVEPKEGIQLRFALNQSKSVFLRCGEVYKLYNENVFTPKIEVMNIIEHDYIPMQKVTLSRDEVLTYYKSEFIAQKEQKNLQLTDFQPIIKALQKLHDAGYVHSDVRLVNLLFPLDDEAKLIDFDLADKVGTLYPDGYNNVLYRHPDAMQGKPRHVNHDRYSLICIIKDLPFYDGLTSQQKHMLQNFEMEQHTTVSFAN